MRRLVIPLVLAVAAACAAGFCSSRVKQAVGGEKKWNGWSGGIDRG